MSIKVWLDLFLLNGRNLGIKTLCAFGSAQGSTSDSLVSAGLVKQIDLVKQYAHEEHSPASVEAENMLKGGFMTKATDK